MVRYKYFPWRAEVACLAVYRLLLSLPLQFSVLRVNIFILLQTGSGKTYTMGTGFRDGCQTGIIPQVMNVLFSKIETLKHQTEFQLHVSFIEVCYGVLFLILL